MGNGSLWKPGSVITPNVNSNLAAAQQVFSPSAGQTLFALTAFNYFVNTGSLVVFVNGIPKFNGAGLSETSDSSFTLSTPVGVTDSVVAIGFTQVTGTVALVSTIQANLTFSMLGAKLYGDFSNATLTNRMYTQTSTLNGATSVGILPNGASVNSENVAYNNAVPTNSAYLASGINGTESYLNSAIAGTGTLLPLSLKVNGISKLVADVYSGVNVLNAALNYTAPVVINASSTVDITTAASNNISVVNATGNTTIANLGVSNNIPIGAQRSLRFSVTGGSLTLSFGAGAGAIYFGATAPATLTVNTDDVMLVEKVASGAWAVVNYKAASGSAPVASTSAGGGVEVTSAVDITLISTSSRVQNVNMTVAGKNVTLPDATTLPGAGGPVFIIANKGSNAFGVKAANGIIIAYVPIGGVVVFSVSNTTNANNGWIYNGSLNAVGNSGRYLANVFKTADLSANVMGVAPLSATTALIVWCNGTSGSNTLSAVVATISSGTISYGSVATSAAIGFANGIDALNVVALSATTALVMVGSHSSTTTYNLHAVGISVSGTTPTFGTASGSLASSANANLYSIFLDATHAFVVYDNSTNYSAVVITYNGASAPTAGTALAISASASPAPPTGSIVLNVICTLVATGKVAIFSGSGIGLNARIASISGTTITLGTELITFLNWNGGAGASKNGVSFQGAFAYSATEVAFISNYGYAVLSVSGTTIALTTSNQLVVANKPVVMFSTTVAFNADNTYSYTSGVGYSYQSNINSLVAFDSITLAKSNVAGMNVLAPINSTSAILLGTAFSTNYGTAYVVAQNL